MDIKQLEALIRDTNKSDEEVYQATVEFLTDIDEIELQTQAGEISRVSLLCRQLRPTIMQRIEDEIAKQHENCCGEGCGTGEASAEPRTCNCCGKTDCKCSTNPVPKSSSTTKDFDDLDY